MSLSDPLAAYLLTKFHENDRHKIPLCRYNHLSSCVRESFDYIFTNINSEMTEEEIQWHCYEAGKIYLKDYDLNLFFNIFYLLLFNQLQGPRIGQIIKLIGVDKCISIISAKLENPL